MLSVGGAGADLMLVVGCLCSGDLVHSDGPLIDSVEESVWIAWRAAPRPTRRSTGSPSSFT